MFRAESFGGHPGIRPFVHNLAAIKADGERFDLLVRGVNGKINDRGGIHAAAGENAHRHVGDHVVAHRRGEQAVKLLRRCLKRHGPALPGEAQIPIRLPRHPALLDREMMSRQQLVDAFEQGFVAGQIIEREKFPDARQIDFARHSGVRNDRLQFGGKIKRPAGLAKIERLDAHPVTRRKQPPLFRVPNRKGKHPSQMTNTLRAEFFVGMNDDFGVRLRAEDVAPGDELFAQCLKIVNLAVENDPD